MQFVENGDLLGEADTGGIGELFASNANTLIKGAIFLAALLLVLLLLVRPALSRMRAEEAQEAASNPEEASPVDPSQPSGSVPPSGMAPKPVADDSEFVSITSVSGNVMKRYIDELSTLIQNNPEEATRTIRSWIRQKG